ncbi:MAG: hypothetical protein LH618_16435, partial [Saprospiraceae bacterium]|nr:hypothetical protein [Saprospiraceae bacterium]
SHNKEEISLLKDKNLADAILYQKAVPLPSVYGRGQPEYEYYWHFCIGRTVIYSLYLFASSNYLFG